MYLKSAWGWQKPERLRCWRAFNDRVVGIVSSDWAVYRVTKHNLKYKFAARGTAFPFTMTNPFYPNPTRTPTIYIFWAGWADTFSTFS